MPVCFRKSRVKELGVSQPTSIAICVMDFDEFPNSSFAIPIRRKAMYRFGVYPNDDRNNLRKWCFDSEAVCAKSSREGAVAGSSSMRARASSSCESRSARVAHRLAGTLAIAKALAQGLERHGSDIGSL